MKQFYITAKNALDSFLSWQWVKKLLYWLVVSGGTVSECVFLVASIWVSVNATVHPLMLKFMSQATTVTLSQLAVSAFTSLPEVILGLAVVTTYGHIKFYRMHKKKSSLAWAILFGIPTVVFASLTIWTLAASALQIGYTMPSVLIATRVLAGYSYGFLSMLFVLIGEPDNADFVSGLKSDVAKLNAEIDSLKSNFAQELNSFRHQAKVTLEEKQNEVEAFQFQLQTQNEQVKRLSEKASSFQLRGLENYPKVQTEWIANDVKTVSIEEAMAVTGHSKRRLNNAKLQRHSRNKDLIMVSSIIEWLRTAPLPETPNEWVKPESKGFNTDPLLQSNGHRKFTQPLELVRLEV